MRLFKCAHPSLFGDARMNPAAWGQWFSDLFWHAPYPTNFYNPQHFYLNKYIM